MLFTPAFAPWHPSPIFVPLSIYWSLVIKKLIFQKGAPPLNIKNNSLWMALAILMVSMTATAQTPTYQNITPPGGIASSAGEPSIGADWKTGKILFQAVLETDQITINPTNPPTATWAKVSPVTSSV